MSVTVWRLHTNTDSKKGKIAQYCLDNKVVAMGWSLTRDHIKTLTAKRQEKITERKNIKTLYC